MKVDSSAEANIISARTYQELCSKPVLQPSEAELKPYSSLLLSLIRQFAATISTNGKQIETILYATKNHNTQSLVSKYTAFDLSILHINFSNQQVPINVHNIDVSEADDQDPHTLHLQNVEHMEYSQMAKHLTPPEVSKLFLRKISDLPQEGQLQWIKECFREVLKGICKYKYCARQNIGQARGIRSHQTSRRSLDCRISC